MLSRIIYGIVVVFPALSAFAVEVDWPWAKSLSGLLPWWMSIVVALIGLLIVIAKRAQQLDQDRDPKISISPPEKYFEPWQDAQDGQKSNRFFYLTITNISSGKIENVSMKETSFTNNQSHTSPVAGRHFRLRSERQADIRKHTYSRAFDLRGSGDSIELDICSLNEADPSSNVIMYYATSPSERYKDSIPRTLFPHILTVRVIADNMPISIEKKYRISIAENGDLGMELLDGK